LLDGQGPPAQLLLLLQAFQSKGKVRRRFLQQGHLFVAKNIRLVPINHEDSINVAAENQGQGGAARRL
jgi:hypothetical protein